MTLADAAHDRTVPPLRVRGLLAAMRAPLVAGIDHAAVVARIEDDSGWSARFIFMTLMSAGIAVLGCCCRRLRSSSARC